MAFFLFWIGTLDGFSFGSDDEGDHFPKAATCQTNQDNKSMDQAKGKRNGKVDKGSVWKSLSH